MAYNKGVHSSGGGSNRGRPYALILLITFGVAVLGVMVLHKLREKRIYTLLVKEKDHQILSLQLLLQVTNSSQFFSSINPLPPLSWLLFLLRVILSSRHKERDRSKELREKNEEMKGKIYALRSQKMELSRTVVEMQSTLDSLKDEQKLMESAFEEQQNELRLMQEKGSNVGQGGSEIVALREDLKHKEAEIEDLKHRLESSVNNHPTTFPEIVTANGTMAGQDESEKEENSSEFAKHEGDDNENASKRELTKSKDGDVATDIRDETRTDGEFGKANEDQQSNGGGAAKDINDAEVRYEREKKAMREEQAENNADSSGQVKQLAGMKRKHNHTRRTKAKHLRTSKLTENGAADNHMGDKKVYKDEVKGRRIGKVSYEETFTREDEGRNKNSPKDKSRTKLLKLENKEDGIVTKVNNTKHDVTVSTTNHRRDETRHINKADKNAEQTETGMLFEGNGELEAVLVAQNQNKDGIDSGHKDGIDNGHKDEIDNGHDEIDNGNEDDNDDEIFKKSHSESQDEDTDE
ncbi:unnamed protein product [Sphenostylis stenocarpa]|uniref:Uncharacterized protein n=1 Tax=Sphenostylis stenocarpa TaxID=92480 RepID=A0AA87B9H8_9FABA|nr:unnamed protein product [Sphenostylis stenocarpa]